MKYLSDYRHRPQGKGCIKWLIRERWKSISDDEMLKKKINIFIYDFEWKFDFTKAH